MRRAPLLLTLIALLCMPAAVAAKGTGDATGGIQPRILNGAEATETNYGQRWPAIAAVIGTFSWGTTLCGGVVIDERTILTAAHCTYNPSNGSQMSASNLEVVVGRRVATDATGDRVPVESIARHPSFDRDLLRNDIAVLRLSRSPVVAIQAIALTSQVDQAWWGAGSGLAPGADAVGPWIAGWGALDAQGKTFPNALHEAKVGIASDATCASNAAPGQGPYFDQNSMVCAGLPSETPGNGVDSCQGDSGGPLIVGNGAGAWRLVGLTSWGQDCGGKFMGVYTRVGRYVEWIEQYRWTPSSPLLTNTSNPVPPPPPTDDTPPPPGSTPPPDARPKPPLPIDGAIGPVDVGAAPKSEGRPTAPTRVRWRRIGHAIEVSWRASKDDGRVVRYRILRKSASGWRQLATTTRLRAVLKGLPATRWTALRIQAVDDRGQRSLASRVLFARAR